MQLSFDLGGAPVLQPLRERLLEFYGPQTPRRRLDPLSHLIKSVVNGRTYDQIAWPVFLKLREAYPGWAGLGDASPTEVEAIIAPVTHAERKARLLPVLIRVLKARPHGLDLSFLTSHTVGEAMAWLQELPGVGPMAAAATLNHSSLNMRVMVVDTHVHRVTRRLGLTSRKGDPAQAFETMMSLIPPDWTADDLVEFHWLLKGLGQDICTDPRALCGRCPLRSQCPRVDVELRRAVLTFPAQSPERSLSQTPNS